MSLFSHNLHPVIKKWHLSSEGINYLVFIQTSQIFKRPLLNITQKISTSIKFYQQQLKSKQDDSVYLLLYLL